MTIFFLLVSANITSHTTQLENRRRRAIENVFCRSNLYEKYKTNLFFQEMNENENTDYNDTFRSDDGCGEECEVLAGNGASGGNVRPRWRRQPRRRNDAGSRRNN